MSKLLKFALGAVSAVAIYCALWLFSLGHYRPAEYWLSEVYVAKDAWASSISEPKIIISSGSNALFGLDSASLARKVRMPVANLAGHAGLPLSFLIEKALGQARRGDVVVMPLEYIYYIETHELTTWQVTNMQSWGRDYLLSDPLRALRYIRYSDFFDIVKSLVAKDPQIASAQTILDTVQQNSERQPEFSYSYQSMDRYGDILVMGDFDPIEDSFYIVDGHVSNYAIKQLSDFRDALTSLGATLWLTWPVSNRNPNFDLSLPDAGRRVNRIVRRLKENGIDVHCAPDTFQYPKSFFLDTVYHLNRLGAELRTNALAACLNESSQFRDARTASRQLAHPG